MCSAEAAGTRRPKSGTAPAAGKEALKEVKRMEKKLREIRKIEGRVAAGERVDPLQHQKLRRKAEVEAQLAEANATMVAYQDGSGSVGFQEAAKATTVASQEDSGSVGFQEAAEATTVASQDGSGSVGFLEAAEKTHSGEAFDWQWDESEREQWQTVYPVFELVPVQVVQVLPWSQQVGAACAAPMVAQPVAPQAVQSAARPATCRRGRSSRLPAVQQGRCERLLEGLEAGGSARDMALSGLTSEVLRFAMDSSGCRVVQRALAVVAGRTSQAELVQGLHGHVLDLVRSPHGNHVVQKVVELLPNSLADFVACELRGRAPELARHRFGCRVLLRLMEHCAGTLANVAALMDELLQELDGLHRHKFGQHVVKELLERAHPSSGMLGAAASQLQGSCGGRRLLRDAGILPP